MPAVHVLASVLRPTVRVSHLGSIVATVVLAAVPALVTTARGGTDLGAPLILLALGAGASVAWSVDDPTGELLVATPVSAPTRASIRVVAAFTGAALVTGVTLAVLAAVGRGLPPDVVDRVPEGASAGAVALAVAFGAARRGDHMSGVTGAILGVLLPAVVAGMAVRWPGSFPGFTAGPLHARWWVLFAAGAVLATWAARDAARR